MGAIRSIVVPTDFSAFSQAAARRAARLASLDDASLHLVHSVRFPWIASPGELSVPAAAWEGVRRAAEEQLEHEKKSLEEQGQSVTAEISDSTDAVAAIAKAVEVHAADLIVMGTHGAGGLRHAFLGSVTERTLRTVHTPVLAVKDDPARATESIQRIVLAADFSEESEQAIELAGELAPKLGARVDVVHAVDVIPDYLRESAAFALELESRLENEAVERLSAIRQRLERRGVVVGTYCQRGRPSVVISELAKQNGAQLVVMGTRGQSGLKHLLLGSVAERTLRAAECSVLAVPPALS